LIASVVAAHVFLANVKGPWLHPDAIPVEPLVAIAHACPSGAVTYERLDGGPPEAAPPVNLLRIRENGPLAVHAAIELEGRPMYRATLCRCGASKNKPFCDGSHATVPFVASGEPQSQPSEPLAMRDGPLSITPTRNGPLDCQGNLEICSGTGRTVARVERARLCRCGGSSNKPFCDGTHARIGFESE
jgi:CDGSH-type Zn-finger protein